MLEFIALDSIQRAINFYDEITSKVLDISSHPYIYRKKDDNENLRELIYKGYTIPFEIDKEKNKIIILGIFNQNLWN